MDDKDEKATAVLLLHCSGKPCLIADVSELAIPYVTDDNSSRPKTRKRDGGAAALSPLLSPLSPLTPLFACIWYSTNRYFIVRYRYRKGREPGRNITYLGDVNFVCFFPVRNVILLTKFSNVSYRTVWTAGSEKI